MVRGEIWVSKTIYVKKLSLPITHTHMQIIKLTFICGTRYYYMSHKNYCTVEAKYLSYTATKCISCVVIKTTGSVRNWLQLQPGLEQIHFQHHKVMFRVVVGFFCLFV